MTVRVFCKCGADVTSDIPLWDRKTRTLFWMDQHAPSCAACRKQSAVTSIRRGWHPNARAAEPRKKLATR